jgi:uncharacterized membrane protein YbhN (UPF0104 family)
MVTRSQERLSSAWRWVRFALEAVLALLLLSAATATMTSIWSGLLSHPLGNVIVLLGAILCFWVGIGIVIHLIKQATGHDESVREQPRSGI